MSDTLVLLGDSPAWPTGLGRILRDLLVQVIQPIWPGRLVVACPGMYEAGIVEPRVEWLTLPLEDTWGSRALAEWWRSQVGAGRGILWTVWDPIRCWPTLQTVPAYETWGYLPLDTDNLGDRYTGVTTNALHRYDRLLAYTRWAAGRVERTVGRPVPYLPHGLDLDVWTPLTRMDRYQHARDRFGDLLEDGSILVGCVAANQPRKDFGLLFQTLRLLKDRYPSLVGWLHTDTLIKADGWGWSIPQLLADTGMTKHVLLTDSLSEVELAALYSLCTITIAPGLGEGFGYPLVESLACGAPCIHHGYGGGAELIPDVRWRAGIRGWRLEGLHAVRRPVLDPVDVFNAAVVAIEDRLAHPTEILAMLALQVKALGWDVLAPRWQEWVRGD